MTKAEDLFHTIANEIPDAIEGKLFGAKCIKLNTGKSVAIFWKDCMLFKLDEKVQQEALKLEGSKIGAHLYDPKRPMKGWVSIPLKHSHLWIDYTKLGVENVKTIESTN